MMHHHLQYPPPPPVATGPGLDRPLYASTAVTACTPSPDYGIADIGIGSSNGHGHHVATNNGGYAMQSSRARKYYQDEADRKTYV